MIPIIRGNDRKAMARLLRARDSSRADALRVASRIISDIRASGDRAVIGWTNKLDGVRLAPRDFLVSREEIRKARKGASKELLKALAQAARNIRATARRQLPRAFKMSTTPGVTVGQSVRPLDRLGCYVPGGRYPLPSTVLMSVIPAQEAGVGDIVITSPRPAPAVMVAADFLGIEKIYRLGGAQAIAALAYGTQTIPRVDKIVGPGNRYVAAAKQLVSNDCGIDFVAGPTELVIIGDRGEPEWIAWDMLAQAEHDPDAIALLITPSPRLAIRVIGAMEKLLAENSLPLDAKALETRCGVILMRDLREAIRIANEFAPEHLTLLDAAAAMYDQIKSAGSVFLGGMSAVAAGDYASGGNHILPTAGAARLRGGLTAADFVKVIPFQRVSAKGLARLRETITMLARTEGLEAHARSIESRFERPLRTQSTRAGGAR